MGLLEFASRILSVVDIARDHEATDDEAEVIDDGGAPIRMKSAGVLFGYYSVPPKAGKALAIQTPVGGFLMRFLTDPPAGAVAGEYGFLFGSAVLRFRPDETISLATTAGTAIDLDPGGNIQVQLAAGKTFGIYYNPAFTKAVVLNGDNLALNPAWAGWFAAVGGGGPWGAPPGVPIGTVTATSQTLKVQ